VTRSVDGRIWFAGFGGVSVVDPKAIVLNTQPPPVLIEDIVADRHHHSAANALVLRSPVRDLRIDFTATSLSLPAKVRFRYKLEGRDQEWIDAGTQRQVAYTDLAPKVYRFNVVASNNDGVWNDRGAVATITILPAAYQTTWFKLSVATVFAFMLGGLYYLRVRGLSNRLRERFEERLNERTRIAQELHDTLLQGVASTSMQLHVVSEALRDHETKPMLDHILRDLRAVADDGRRAIVELRSARTSESLEDILTRDGQALRGDSNIELRVVVDGRVRPVYSLVQDEMYRISREAMTNVFRHARAHKIEVLVEYASSHLSVHISDDGCGISEDVLKEGKEGHWGIPGMRERAKRIGARMRILSRPNAGTEVVITVPAQLAYDTVSK
jgi:signal transduction histidine kinase